MVQFHEIVSWFLGSLGVALLICSPILVPANAVLGQTGDTCGAGQGECSIYKVKDDCSGKCADTNENCTCQWGTQCDCKKAS